MRGHGTEYRNSDDEFELWLQGDGEDGNEDRCSGEAAEFAEHVTLDVDGNEGDQDTVLHSGEAM